ncbi:MAG: hypothetical protein AB9866_06935 [Syntrophobacteraceae bacterium]
MDEKKKGLPVLGLVALALFACWTVSLSEQGLAGSTQSWSGDTIRLAASRGGRDSLSLERDLRDTLMENPPFYGSPEPGVPGEYPQPPTQSPEATQYMLPQRTEPRQVRPAHTPAPPPSSRLPELYVRGYSVDATGAISIIGMDGALRKIDASRPVKLIFPPESGLAPQIIGGSGPVPPAGGHARVYGSETAAPGLQRDPAGMRGQEISYYQSGARFFGEQQWRHAIDQFSRAIEIEPRFAEAYAVRGLACAAVGRFDQAIMDSTSALTMNPGLSFAHETRAIGLYARNRYNEAWIDVRKAQSMGHTVNPKFLGDLRKASGRRN